MADKTKTIKGATDKELDELVARLRKEREVQGLISEIKRGSSSGYIPYDYGQEISTEKPIESLYHYGILGMRWGMRKRRGSSVTKSKSSNKSTDNSNDSEDHMKKVTLRSKKVSEMSNDELQAFTKRMNLEKQYKELTKTEVSAGRKFVTDVLTNSAKTIATTYVTRYATKGLDALLKKASGD
jgi:hypothetical protein